MSRFAWPGLVLAAVVTSGHVGMAAPGLPSRRQALSVSAVFTEKSHDFGELVIGGVARAKLFVRLTTPKKPSSNWNPGALIPFQLEGADKDSFRLENESGGAQPSPGVPVAPLVDKTFVTATGGLCHQIVPGQVLDCEINVYFMPKTVGRKTADLVSLDPDGLPATATLIGVGKPACVMKVVPCNYGPLYTGLFSWTRDLTAPGSSHKENVRVQVTDGVAACHGSVVDTENRQSVTGVIEGPGLFAVEFEPDPMYGYVYLVTVACPTAAYPAIPKDGVEATKSEPAELGHNDQNSEKQPAKGVAQVFLEGTLRYPAPETDPINHVTGTVSISWQLTRK